MERESKQNYVLDNYKFELKHILFKINYPYIRDSDIDIHLSDKQFVRYLVKESR